MSPDHRAFAPRVLPAGLEPLTTLALDLRWTWSHGADHLWRRLDPEAWSSTQNPWVLLREASEERLAVLAADPQFRRDLDAVLAVRHRSLAVSSTRAGVAALRHPVAYFSMEFGLGEAIPLYAGGLGVLAGDHLKAASDLAVPIVAVGLLYQEGYFRQVIDSAGHQEELYPFNDPMRLPIQPVLAPDGNWLTVTVELPGRSLQLRAWRAAVGRVGLHLLDANVAANDAIDRSITSKLYSDGPEMRIRQEMALGLGGHRLLEALAIAPGVCHLNEGHAAFVVLERARVAMQKNGLTFSEALTATRAGTVFTTHTPVAAGFDVFPTALVARYFPEGGAILGALGLSLSDFLALGRAPGAHDDEPFRPAYLALHGAGHVNAVSALHGETSREIFGPLFPRLPRAEVPITHVTNGVHVPSWDSAFADELWTGMCGADRWRGDVDGHEEAIRGVSDELLWSVRARSRAALVERVRARLARQRMRRGVGDTDIAEARRALDPDVLTLGFARRFAAYKRPNLLLRDVERLRRLIADQRRPVQLVVAGKAHPEDRDGKALVEAWVRFCDDPQVRARCIFLEDYDLALAQELVQGVDVWLNTPLRPWEACGTSGMKVLVNGGLNLSVLDGWWAEAYEPGLGWAVDAPTSSFGAHDVDGRDALTLFAIIEQQVVPAFYERDSTGLPRAWLGLVRESLARLTPRFSANRMMLDYVTTLYAPAERELSKRLDDTCAGGRELERWRRRLATAWSGVRFGRLQIDERADSRTFSAEVFLNDVEPTDVAVELYADAATADSLPERIAMTRQGPLPGTTHGYLFVATTSLQRPAPHYTPRVVPASARAFLPIELPLSAWRS